MEESKKVEVEVLLSLPNTTTENNAEETFIFDSDSEMDSLSSKADKWDYIVAIGSGILCGMLDVFWVGDFSLSEGRDIVESKVEGFVIKIAQWKGCPSDNLEECIRFLEKKFPIPSDGNTADFGGGLQHHLRDFAHHPSIIGLVFSMLTQFTGKSYGTDASGKFIMVDVPENKKYLIGNDIPTKIIYGTVIWFFHLVSDMAGSSSTASSSGGTGIPGPILSFAKELSALPFFQNLKVENLSISQILSKIFNGTLFAEHDENGKIIKESVFPMDLRGELAVLIELGKQALPVIANECIVRTFYMLRRLFEEVKEKQITCLDDFKKIPPKNYLPYHSPTLTRMLTVATGVFTTLDLTDAFLSQKYWVAVNFVGVSRFIVALGNEIVWTMKRRNVKHIKDVYEKINQNIYGNTYVKMDGKKQDGMDFDKFGLNEEETEILYNVEFYKTLHDIETAKLIVGNESILKKKREWLEEWKTYLSENYSRFINKKDAQLHWYSLVELQKKIEENDPKKTWLRLVLLEAMLFEPYFPLTLVNDKKGNTVLDNKYKALQNSITGYKWKNGDQYLEVLSCKYLPLGYVSRLRKSYDRIQNELNETFKKTLQTVGIAVAVGVATALTLGAFAPSLAVLLVGSEFQGLGGAALTSACLAYLGGGAIAAGGAGMAGGTMVIVGGGAVLGMGIGSSASGISQTMSQIGKKAMVAQTSKLMVTTEEIFINDEKDIQYASFIYERYVQNIEKIKKEIVDLELKMNIADSKEKKKLKARIKNLQETVDVMVIAMKNMNRYINEFKNGIEKS